MVPQGGWGGHRNIGGNLRQPPAWAPEMERQYPFRHFARDLLLWSCATDLQPHQQAATTILQLGGAARDMVREMNPTELLQGGVVNTPQGQMQLDPMGW